MRRKYETETNSSNLKSKRLTSALPLPSGLVTTFGLELTSGFVQLLQYAIPSRIEKPAFEITSTVQLQ
jgi:hypothetical protein